MPEKYPAQPLGGWSHSPALMQTSTMNDYGEMDSSPDIADEAAARALTEELATETYSPSDQDWTITVQNAPAAE